jgi:hypothetical protein
MTHFIVRLKKAAYKNIWAILGVTLLAVAWILERSAIQSQQMKIESKRLLWDQYRVDNNIYALITSKYEIMRFVDLETAGIPKDTTQKSQILLQLRFALFDHLRLRIENDEAVYLLEKDPLDQDTAKMLNEKRIEAANAFNSGDISKLLILHQRDNDYSFNNAEKRTHQYVKDFNALLMENESAEHLYLLMYVLGSILVVLQKIMDTINHENEKVETKIQKKLAK